MAHEQKPEEKKLYAVPADWPQPAFAIGEKVYDVADQPGCPIPGEIVGLIFHLGTLGYMVA